MKIGDTVRFLSEVGGGKVSGFKGKDIVLVEDEDGFEIPMLMKEVVVVDSDDYSRDGVSAHKADKAPKPRQAETPKPQPAPVFRHVEERSGGDVLNLYLSFVPDDVKEISSTTFESYFVNDSNYFMQVMLLGVEGPAWGVRFSAVVEPNSKAFIEEFDRSALVGMERLCVQAIAWKQGKPFALKPAMTVELRLDCTKFYKLHAFRPNEFFRDPNWTVPVISGDKPVRSLFVDAGELQEALLTPNRIPARVDDKPHAAAGHATEKKSATEKKPAPQKSDVIELDLHIDKLLDNTAGLSNADMLLVQMKEFRRVMDENVMKLGQKIIVIHGKGDGVLRKNILQELKYRYKNCSSHDASFREYGYGATQVTVHNQKK